MKSNPFKEIGKPHKEIPDKLKEKLLADLDIIVLLMEVSMLFTNNYKATFLNLLKKTKHNKSTT